MLVESFKPFSADSLLNQLYTGLTYVSNPFQIEEPTKQFENQALDIAVTHFKDSNIEVRVSVRDGFTTITANIK